MCGSYSLQQWSAAKCSFESPRKLDTCAVVRKLLNAFTWIDFHKTLTLYTHKSHDAISMSLTTFVTTDCFTFFFNISKLENTWHPNKKLDPYFQNYHCKADICKLHPFLVKSSLGCRITLFTGLFSKVIYMTIEIGHKTHSLIMNTLEESTYSNMTHTPSSGSNPVVANACYIWNVFIMT